MELSLRVRERLRGKGGTGSDRGSRNLIGVLFAAAVWLSLASMRLARSLRIPGQEWVLGAGLIVMWLGLVIRIWAIISLGNSFRTTVEVDTGQTVVSRGPYRWVRHPSYTGLLLILSGFGLGLDNWLSLALCALLPAVALLYRIMVEESELSRVLGERYDAYRTHTRRLIPGVW